MLIFIFFSEISFLFRVNMIQFWWKGEILMILEKAYAKLNLFLDIENKLPNGYHSIVSLMQTVDWCDNIYIGKNVSNEIVLSADSRDIPIGRDNVAYRAAESYLKTVSASDGVDIRIEKCIPVAAGMAGGSADAAAVLRGMNRLFDNRLSISELLELGKGIGADVPFCLLGGTKLARGIGEALSDCECSFPDCAIVCAKLGEGISAPEAYRLLDEKYDNFRARGVRTKDLQTLLDGMKQNYAKAASLGFFNVFEEVIGTLRPSVEIAKAILLEHGAFAAMMSGSGPSVFGLFHNDVEAEIATQALISRGAQARTCHPVSRI